MRDRKKPENEPAAGEATKDMQSYDIIGDIHGHADELRALLASLGYRNGRDAYCHPEGRKVIFLGDFIDRGPKIREVLETVRAMVDAGQALAILGNHEVNAMRYGTIGSDGGPLRPHTPNNTIQHKKTLDEFRDPAEWALWLKWFAGLPFCLDLGGLRAVHACWDAENLRELSGIGRLEGPVLEKFSRKGTPEYDAISLIINGPEAELPEGYQHETADGRTRTEFRVKWWLDIAGLNCRQAIFPGNPAIPELPPHDIPKTGYPQNTPPTFFGHYALKSGTPAPIRPNLACLDYGTGKGGFLCAYRWDGEKEIDPGKFVTAPEEDEK
ncbi:MAG: metallophosphoesterase [Verrucomicrobiota bacterium]